MEHGPRSRSTPIDPAWLGRALESAAAAFAVDLAPVLPGLAAFADDLLRWNERINLTGARDADTLVREHLADALPAVVHVPPQSSWVDVGSGAGLPGIVLALLRPASLGVLLEPLEKRRVFLRSVVRSLGLARVEVLGERFEAHSASHAHRYDVAISRAVLPLAAWLAAAPALVRPGGAVLGFAGREAQPLPLGAVRLDYDVGAGPRALIRLTC